MWCCRIQQPQSSVCGVAGYSSHNYIGHKYVVLQDTAALDECVALEEKPKLAKQKADSLLKIICSKTSELSRRAEDLQEASSLQVSQFPRILNGSKQPLGANLDLGAAVAKARASHFCRCCTHCCACVHMHMLKVFVICDLQTVCATGGNPRNG